MNTHKNSSFPIEIFPLSIQRIIKEAHETSQYPLDFIAASILFASSVAIGNTYKAKVSNNHIENAVLFLAIVGRPGTNKSAPLRFALEPIFKHDQKTFSDFLKKSAEYNEALTNFKKKKSAPGTKEPIKPVWQKYIVSDFTQEGLVLVHSMNRRGLGVYVDELAGWFKNFNRFNKGSDGEFWLGVWSSAPINVDRKLSDPILITDPFISVGGTIQNDILKALASGDRQKNGFIDRILFVIPDNLRKLEWTEDELGEDVIESWQTFVDNLLLNPIIMDENSNPKATLLKFSKEAKELLVKWQSEVTAECNLKGDDRLTSIYGKLEVYAIRFTLILQLMGWAAAEKKKEEIEVEAVKGAIRLVDYFLKSALEAHLQMSTDNPLEEEPKNVQTLYDQLPESFTTAEGLIVAKLFDMPERNFKRLLTKKELFDKQQRGIYKKLL